MDTFEEKVVFGIGCALLGIGALCLLPFTRRRLARAPKRPPVRAEQAEAAVEDASRILVA